MKIENKNVCVVHTEYPFDSHLLVLLWQCNGWVMSMAIYVFSFILYCSLLQKYHECFWIKAWLDVWSIVEIFCYAIISTNVQYLKWNEFMVKLCVLNSNETWKRYDISKWFETYTQSVRINVDALGCFTFNLIVTWSCLKQTKKNKRICLGFALQFKSFIVRLVELYVLYDG